MNEETLVNDSQTLWPDVVGETPGPHQQVSLSGRVFTVPPQLLQANQSTTVYLTLRPRQVCIQNNTANVVYRSYDQMATPASFAIQPGQTCFDTVRNETVSFYVTATSVLNGPSGVVVEVYE